MKYLMKWVGLALLLLGLAACGTEEAAPTAEPTTADSPAAVAQNTATAVPATETATAVPPTATTAPTAVPTETAIPTPEVVASNCLDCHSNQEMLINTAAPEVAPEEGESSGVG